MAKSDNVPCENNICFNAVSIFNQGTFPQIDCINKYNLGAFLPIDFGNTGITLNISKASHSYVTNLKATESSLNDSSFSAPSFNLHNSSNITSNGNCLANNIYNQSINIASITINDKSNIILNGRILNNTSSSMNVVLINSANIILNPGAMIGDNVFITRKFDDKYICEPYNFLLKFTENALSPVEMTLKKGAFEIINILQDLYNPNKNVELNSKDFLRLKLYSQNEPLKKYITQHAPKLAEIGEKIVKEQVFKIQVLLSNYMKLPEEMDFGSERQDRMKLSGSDIAIMTHLPPELLEHIEYYVNGEIAGFDTDPLGLVNSFDEKIYKLNYTA